VSCSGLFITGTGTEVGKTYVAALMARTLVARGLRVGVYKPAASGCRREGAALVADDALALWEAAGRPGSLDAVCPQRFLAAIAPPQAARAEGRTVDAALLRSGVEPWRAASDFVLVEGAGGLFSPLGERDLNIDLAADLGYPALVVAADELGTIHATLATIEAARRRAPGLRIAGVVLNQTRSRSEDASVGGNAAEIAQYCDAPVWGCVEYGALRLPDDVVAGLMEECK
jgi:dethiobiotin synthetase